MWARYVLLLGLVGAAVAGICGELFWSRRAKVNGETSAEPRGSRTYAGLVDEIDEEFHQRWTEACVEPTERADDLILARRIAQGLTGTVPSLEEIRLLEAVRPEQRLDWWLSKTLSDRRYADYVAERLARAFVGTEKGPFLQYRRRRFVLWLSDQLFANTPYNEIVQQLLTDTGLWTDSPAVNFVTVTLGENNKNRPDPIRLAGRTTRAFLGMRIDCLQCHDDYLGTLELGTADNPRGGLQSDFHQLAAFFSEVETSAFGIRDREHAYRYKYLNDTDEQTISPTTPFLQQLLKPGSIRRQQLAAWVTHPHNKAFARATVNRVWALLCGKPLVEPIDELPLHGPFPPGLERLAADFVEHGFDHQRLIRVIVATEAFQRDSRASFPITSDHEEVWAAYPLTRLRPDQVAGGIIQAASLTTLDASAHIITQLRRYGEQNDFVKRYGDTGEDEFEDRSGTVAQRLLLMNGKLIKDRTKNDLLSNAATRIAALAATNAQAVETAYLATLSRLPTVSERERFEEYLGESRGQRRRQHLEDLYWVLLNSTEFTWNH